MPLCLFPGRRLAQGVGLLCGYFFAAGRGGDATAFQPRLDLGLIPGPRLRADTNARRKALLAHQPHEGRPIADDVALLEIFEPKKLHGHPHGEYLLP